MAEKIRTEALLLSEAERAELAHSLILSLEADTDEDAETAWDAELGKRLQKIESGESKGRPVEDILREIKARHS